MVQSAWAADQVVLLLPDEPSDLVAEAAVRISAELRSSGFVVVQHQKSSWDAVDAPTYVGQMQLLESGAYVEIRARATSSRSPVLQRADPREAQTSAEVIAIRAVESLRAVLLQALQKGTLDENEISSTVQEFTSFAPRPEPVSERPKPLVSQPPPAAVSVPPLADSPKTERSPLSGALALAPTLVALGTEGMLSAGLEGRAIMGYGILSLEIVAEGSLVPARNTTAAGTLKARHLSLLLLPGFRIDLDPFWEVRLGVAAGLNQMQFSTTAGPNLNASDASHISFLLQGDLSAGRFWKNGLGLWAFVRAGGLLNAPVIDRVGHLSEFGRPLVNMGLGMAWRIPALSAK